MDLNKPREEDFTIYDIGSSPEAEPVTEAPEAEVIETVEETRAETAEETAGDASPKCDCGPECTCGCQEGGECTCGDECKCREGGECTCGDNCTCGDECKCQEGGECTCGDNCTCGEGCKCGEGCRCGAVAERVDELSAKLDELTRLFNEKIKTDAHKDALFDKMYEELASYKRDLYAKILKPFINETISLMEDCERFIEKMPTLDPERIAKFVEAFPEDLNDMLENNDVERYTDDVERFNPRTQRVIKTIPTPDNSLDNVIAERVRQGYRWNGVILKPEIVKIYKFSATAQATAPATENE